LALDEEIVESAAQVDLALIMGTGFPPFRGGLLRHADTIGVDKIRAQLERYSQGGAGERLRPNGALSEYADRGKFYS
jgi:3-hydroxyacyl-CoA dehydrogenase/enoyl-CoA hydratase/3-hydroxybutyryl-CoA epimerase